MLKGYIRPDSLIGAYLKLKESGAPEDFPKVMADVMHKLLLDAFRGFPSPWRQYAKVTEANDFRAQNRAWLSESEDLLTVAPGGPYETTPLKDRGYSVTVTTLGRTFQLLRQTVINDDLNAFKAVPQKLGRAAIRTLAKKIMARLEGNGAAYDGNALFTSGHANQSETALTADANGIAAVQAGITAIAVSTDPDTSEIMGAQAKYLLTSPSRAENAKWIVSATQIGRGSTDAPVDNPLRDPALAVPIQVLVEPMLTAFPNRWYLLADPEITPVLEVAFLNGNQEPELFLKSSDAVRVVGGGRDEFGFDYDDIDYKVRWDFGVATAYYQGAYKGGQ